MSTTRTQGIDRIRTGGKFLRSFDPRSKTGVIGVSIVHRKGNPKRWEKPCTYYMASPMRKSFSWKRYGQAQAFKLACDCRARYELQTLRNQAKEAQ